jgi:hypothetical protein
MRTGYSRPEFSKRSMWIPFSPSHKTGLGGAGTELADGSSGTPVVDFQVHDEERAGGVDGGSFDLLGVLAGVRQSATGEQRRRHNRLLSGCNLRAYSVGFESGDSLSGLVARVYRHRFAATTMPKALSGDLRERVIEAVKAEMSNDSSVAPMRRDHLDAVLSQLRIQRPRSLPRTSSCMFGIISCLS